MFLSSCFPLTSKWKRIFLNVFEVEPLCIFIDIVLSLEFILSKKKIYLIFDNVTNVPNCCGCIGAAIISKSCTNYYAWSNWECESCACEQWYWAKSWGQKESCASKGSRADLGRSYPCRLAREWAHAPFNFFFRFGLASNSWFYLVYSFHALRLLQLVVLTVPDGFWHELNWVQPCLKGSGSVYRKCHGCDVLDNHAIVGSRIWGSSDESQII